MSEITENIEAKKEDIENSIYEIIPKNITEEYFDKYINNGFYKYDKDALDKGIFLPIRDLLERGGKRWRPYMLLLLLECFGLNEEEIKKHIDFSSIVEIVHNGTLLVDDIEDRAEMRRGKSCVHKIYGEDVAINAGNAMYFLPLKIVRSSNVSNEKKIRLYEAYEDEMNNLSFGQAMDIVWHKNNSIPSQEEYLQMCLCKTGALSSMSARFACILSGKSKKEEMLFAKAIGHLGVGFQIQDDILDIALKDRGDFGKSYGNDITEGKKTLMVIYTCSIADKEDKEELISILNEHTRDKAKIDKAIEILNKYNSVEYSAKIARKIAESSWKDIENQIDEKKAKQELKDFFDYLINRKI